MLPERQINQQTVCTKPLVKELVACLHQAEGPTLGEHAFVQLLLVCVDTCLKQSLNGSLHQLQRQPACSYNSQGVQES